MSLSYHMHDTAGLTHSCKQTLLGKNQVILTNINTEDSLLLLSIYTQKILQWVPKSFRHKSIWLPI